MGRIQVSCRKTYRDTGWLWEHRGYRDNIGRLWRTLTKSLGTRRAQLQEFFESLRRSETLGNSESWDLSESLGL